MAELTYVIDEAHEGSMVKDYVRRTLGFSARSLTKLKKQENGITVSGKPARSIDILHAGDILVLNLEDAKTDYAESAIPLDIVYEDANYLLVNKPFGMTVYKCGNVANNLNSAVAGYYADKEMNVVFRPFYRLDKDTTGIVVVAKNSLIMSSTELYKEYYAVCEGCVPSEGVINKKIGLAPGSAVKRTVGTGEDAVTEYKRIAFDGENSLVCCKLLTGRTHQIRVHMSSIGHPLCGDDFYGGRLQYITRQALHCGSVRIVNKALDMRESFYADFPDDMRESFPKLFE